jgi:hypothetical protein
MSNDLTVQFIIRWQGDLYEPEPEEMLNKAFNFMIDNDIPYREDDMERLGWMYGFYVRPSDVNYIQLAIGDLVWLVSDYDAMYSNTATVTYDFWSVPGGEVE